MKKQIYVFLYLFICFSSEIYSAAVAQGKIYEYYIWPNLEIKGIKRDIIASARTVISYYACMLIPEVATVYPIESGYYKPYYDGKIQSFASGDAALLLNFAVAQRSAGANKKNPQYYVYYVLDNQKGVVGSFDKCGEDLLDYFKKLEIPADKDQIKMFVEAMVLNFDFDKLQDVHGARIPTLMQTCDYLFEGLKAAEEVKRVAAEAEKSEKVEGAKAGEPKKPLTLLEQIQAQKKLRPAALKMNYPHAKFEAEDFAAKKDQFATRIVDGLISHNPGINTRKLIKYAALEVVTYRENEVGFANYEQRVETVAGVVEKLLALGGDGLAVEEEEPVAAGGAGAEPAVKAEETLPSGILSYEEALPYLVKIAQKELGKAPSLMQEMSVKRSFAGTFMHGLQLSMELTSAQKSQIVDIALGKKPMPELVTAGAVPATKPGAPGAMPSTLAQLANQRTALEQACQCADVLVERIKIAA